MRTAINRRVTALRAARRTVYRWALALMLVPAGFATLFAGSAREIAVVLLPLAPLLVVMLIAAGVLEAAVCDRQAEPESAAAFPQPLELRG